MIGGFGVTQAWIYKVAALKSVHRAAKAQGKHNGMSKCIPPYCVLALNAYV